MTSSRKQLERGQLESLFRRITQLGYDSPQSIIDSERPDFVLEIGRRKVGLETTFAVHQEFVRAQKLKHNVCPEACVVTGELKDGNRRRSNDEILHDMLAVGGPWQDAEKDMQDWRDKIANSLQVKREKLSQPNFQLFDENWLLVVDDPSLAEDAFTYDCACRHLAALFSGPVTTKDNSWGHISQLNN